MMGLFRAMHKLTAERTRLAIAVTEHGKSARRVESASESLRKRRATAEEKEAALDALVKRMRVHGAAE